MDNIDIEYILSKSTYDIRDVAKILGKQTQTIRKWEKKGIINKCNQYTLNKWRSYTKDDLANLLETLLNYNWERNPIKNPGQIYYLIIKLREKVYYDL